LDKTYEAALTIHNDDQQKRSNRRSKQPEVTGPPTYAFHKRYVEDVSDIIKGDKGLKQQLEVVKQKLKKDKKMNVDGWRLTRFSQFNIAYILPPLKEGRLKKPSLALQFVRSLALSNLDNLILLQETENAKLKE
jgi:hypothetical protein